MKFADISSLARALGLIAGAAGGAPQTTVPLSIQSLVKCADAGVAECQFQLGEMTERGAGAVKDASTAKRLYELAYKNGYEPAGAGVLRLTRAINGGEAGASRDEPVSVNAPVNVAAPATGTSAEASPDNWPIVLERGAPRVWGINLGDTEAAFSQIVSNSVCTNKNTHPPTRQCEGSLADGKISVDADFLNDSLNTMTFGATLPPQECLRLDTRLRLVLGRTTHGFLSGLISMGIPGNARVWSNKQWTVLSACVTDGASPSDAMLMVMDPTAAGVKD